MMSSIRKAPGSRVRGQHHDHPIILRPDAGSGELRVVQVLCVQGMRVVGEHEGGHQVVHANGQDDAVSGGVDVNVAFLDESVVVGQLRGLDADVDVGARLVLQVLGDFVGEARGLFVLCEDWNA